MQLIILGAGGFGHTIKDIAEQTCKYSSIMFLDDNSTSDEILGKFDEFAKYIDVDTEFYPAIGDNELRYSWIQKLHEAGANIATIVHPSSYISHTASIGMGCAILPHASVGTDVILSIGCIVNMGAIVDHNTQLGIGVHLAPGAIVKGDNLIPAYTKVESGRVIGAKEYPFSK